MTLSMHQATTPPMVATLKALSDILAKAQAAVAGGQVGEAELMEARLSPDMFALPRQVQIATDMAKNGVARLAGREPPVYPDVETSLAELQERIARTVAYLESVPAAEIDGSEAREIILKFGAGQEMKFAGQAYLLRFVLPNLYFHAATAYGLLRHKGLALEKKDFLGEL